MAGLNLARTGAICFLMAGVALHSMGLMTVQRIDRPYEAE